MSKKYIEAEMMNVTETITYYKDYQIHPMQQSAMH